MKKVLHKSETRGHADHGWLRTYHTFSFANYYEPKRMHFGVLRVLNDDYVAGGMGFGTHPHDNMEIITIPISGKLEHKDDMGNGSIINAGEIQVMSAGSGIQHSEFNPDKNETTNLLQIWVFPDKQNLKPRYQQISLSELAKENEFYQILSSSDDDKGVWIHQNAWFHIGDFSKETNTSYKLKSENNGVYIFVISGSLEVAGEKLNNRDGMGISDVSELEFIISANSKILLMDIPMQNGK